MAIEVVFEKRINNIAVHHDVDMERQRQYFLLTFLAALFGLGLLFYGWQQYRWIQSGYEIETAQKKKDELAEYRNQLLLEKDSLSRDERVDSIARNELGMVVPAAGQTVTLSLDAPFTIPVAEPESPALTAKK